MMNSEFKHLRISQLDRSLKATRSIPPRPADGWIAALREALGLTLADLGRRVHMTKQSIQQFERTEANDRITLGNLRLMAEAMGCNLVYTFVPKTGSLADLARQSARAGATRDGPVPPADRRHACAVSGRRAGRALCHGGIVNL